MKTTVQMYSNPRHIVRLVRCSQVLGCRCNLVGFHSCIFPSFTPTPSFCDLQCVCPSLLLYRDPGELFWSPRKKHINVQHSLEPMSPAKPVRPQTGNWQHLFMASYRSGFNPEPIYSGSFAENVRKQPLHLIEIGCFHKSRQMCSYPI